MGIPHNNRPTKKLCILDPLFYLYRAGAPRILCQERVDHFELLDTLSMFPLRLLL